jgi:hypothetical protein
MNEHEDHVEWMESASASMLKVARAKAREIDLGIAAAICRDAIEAMPPSPERDMTVTALARIVKMQQGED